MDSDDIVRSLVAIEQELDRCRTELRNAGGGEGALWRIGENLRQNVSEPLARLRRDLE